jgi:hypothetical protein
MDFVVDFSPRRTGSIVEERRLQQIGYGNGTLNPPPTRVYRGGVRGYPIHWRYLFSRLDEKYVASVYGKTPNTAHRPNLSGQRSFSWIC